MRARVSALFLSSLIFLAVALIPTASGQEAADIFITPVPNAPFHAFVEVKRSVVVRDGSVQDFESYREIGRDSHGRIHNESRKMVKSTSHKDATLIRVHLYDPQTRISTWIDPEGRTFGTITVNHPPATVPPQIRFEGSAGSGVPANEFTREEDLGFREIEGVRAHGVRETQIIAAEASDSGKEIAITDEYWYSEELRINLLVKHSDPRTETITLSLAQITRDEPDAAFFEVPDGYVQRGMKR
jgi:hypothetical protein